MESDANTRNGSSCFHIFKGMLVVILSLAVLAGIFMALISLKKNRLNRSFCRTDYCKKRAMNIKESMDTSVNPCKHFFNFTCGNYKSKKVGEPNWASTTTKLLYKRYLETVLSDTPKFIPPAENFRTFHDVCVNVHSHITKMKFKNDLKNVVKRLKWPPLTKNWNSAAAKFDWLKFEGELINVGFSNSLFTFNSISLADRNQTLMIQCGLPLYNKVGITKENEMTDLVSHIIKQLKGEQKLAKEIAKFVMKIDKIKRGTMPQKTLYRDTTYATRRYSKNIITLGDAEKKWKINFVKFCRLIFPSYMNITKSTKIYYLDDCPTQIINLLKKSSKRTVAGYMLLEGIIDFLGFAPDDAKKINRYYRKFLDDTPSESEFRNLYCYDINTELLPDLWHYIYVKRYSSKERRNRVLKMLNLILDEGNALISNSWLSASSKKVLNNKLSTLNLMVDHDEEYVTDKHIQSTFGDIKFNASEIIKSIMHMRAHSFKRKWVVFTVNTEKREIFQAHTELVANAFNVKTFNMLIIPAPVIAPLLYSDDFEDSLNFGGLATILGHEIFHTIDHGSMMVDDKLNYGLWLNGTDKSVFDEKVQCFVNQYNNYQLTSEFHVSGNTTIDENLSDSGILLTYRTYLKWLKSNKVKKLPGLGKYNNRQIFWITFANIWCETYTKEYLESVYHENDDVHTISKFRVLGTLSNFEEFSKDFNCPANSDMNPKNKCKLYH